ncbi:MAG TPA: NAD(+)/NADH kinase [Vicinamibacterales bacterium]|jgi:NAD+ kinase
MNRPEPEPPSTIARVGIVARAELHEAAGHLAQIAAWLEARGVRPVFDAATAGLTSGTDRFERAEKDELPRVVDLLLVLGGDGTLLGMADRIGCAGTRVPIMGVNFGSLGFLTEITLAELYPALEDALANRALIEERLMLRSVTLRAGRVLAEEIALNDVVITRAARAPLLDLSVSVDEQFLMSVKADGLIVATPTGSTAYNLAVSGPIVHPHVDAFTITPIAPHTLTNRPIVVPAEHTVKVQPLASDRPSESYVTFDGQAGFQLLPGDVVTMRRADHPLRLVRSRHRTYFDILRQKLKWGER